MRAVVCVRGAVMPAQRVFFEFGQPCFGLLLQGENSSLVGGIQGHKRTNLRSQRCEVGEGFRA